MGSSTGTLFLSEEKGFRNSIKKFVNEEYHLHSEDETRLKERFQKLTKKRSYQHEIWRDKTSAIISTKKILKYANKYNTKAHILHISTKDEIDLIKKTKKNITAEVTPQHLTLYSPGLLQKTGIKITNESSNKK